MKSMKSTSTTSSKLSKKVNNDSPILERAKDFLKKKISKKEFVFPHNEIPERRLKEFMVNNNVIFSPIKGLYVIKRDPNIPNTQIIQESYYQIISKLDGFISGKDALNYYIGNNKQPDTLTLLNSDKNVEVQLGDSKYKVLFKKVVGYRDVTKVELLNGSKIKIESELSFLINNFSEFKKDTDFQSLLKNHNINFNDLGVLIKKGINIAQLSKLGLYYKEQGNIRNFSIIQNEIKKAGKVFVYNNSEKKSENLFADIFNIFSSNEKVDNINPKLERFKKFVDKIDSGCDEYFKGKKISIPTFTNVKNTLIDIDNNIIHDTYHSLTIEDYNVSLADIKILNNTDDSNPTNKKIESKLAIKGYLNAFKFVKESIKYDFLTNPKITDKFIKDINKLLFQEGWTAKKMKMSHGYRTNPVKVLDHIPVQGLENITEYMNLFLKHLNSMPSKTEKDIIKKAVFAHYIFVYIHPFGDGNGRTGRFLMNYILSSSGLKWLIINSDDRNKYLSSLGHASNTGDISKFIDFVTKNLVKINK